jgi:hypothetical protein
MHGDHLISNKPRDLLVKVQYGYQQEYQPWAIGNILILIPLNQREEKNGKRGFKCKNR